MEINNIGEILDRLKRLVAENNSLLTKLEECRTIITARDKEIEVLHNMVAEAGAMRSVTDNKIEELNLLQNYIAEIKDVVQHASFNSGGMPMQQAHTTFSDEELEEIKELNTYLQVQLRELKTEVAGLKERNTGLEHNAGRVAELESMLANAVEELNTWKNYVMSKG
jgi:DNA repair ATPase RecN